MRDLLLRAIFFEILYQLLDFAGAIKSNFNLNYQKILHERSQMRTSNKNSYFIL